MSNKFWQTMEAWEKINRIRRLSLQQEVFTALEIVYGSKQQTENTEKENTEKENANDK